MLENLSLSKMAKGCKLKSKHFAEMAPELEDNYIFQKLIISTSESSFFASQGEERLGLGDIFFILRWL